MVLILVLVVGWNYGMGTQLFDWIEQMRKPVVKELDISGINSPYAVLMQVRGGRVTVRSTEKNRCIRHL